MTVSPDRPSDLTRRTVLRRAAAAGLLATPAAGFLAACKEEGTDGTNGAEKTKENPFGVGKGSNIEVAGFNGGFGEDYFKFNQAKYEQKFSAKVDLKFSKTILTDYQPRFYGGNPPDVLNNSSPETIPVPNLIKGAALTDLTQLLDAPSVDNPDVKVRDTLVAGTVEEGTIDGKMYTLNYAYSIYGHWYNQALFEKEGWTVPKTWEEFTTLAEAAKAKGIAAYTTQGIHPWYIHNVVMEWVFKAGGDDAVKAIDNLEPNAWKSEAVKATAERLAEIVGKGWFQPGADGLDHTTTQQAVIDNKALFIWCGSWLEAEMGQTIGTAKLAVAPPWSLTSSDKAAYGAVHAAPGEGFVVPAKAKNVAGGLEFLRQMLSKESARKFAELTKSLPVVKGAADGLTVSNALASASKVAAEASQVINWRIAGWYDGTPLMNGLFANGTELIAGRLTPTAFMDAMQKAADDTAKDDKITKFKR